MENPDISEKLGGYILTWPKAKLRIVVNKIRQHRDDRVTAWLMIYSSSTGKELLLHQADLNFTSTSTQKSLAKSMSDRFEQLGHSWENIIETLRYFVLERVRTGEPVMESYSDEDDIVPPTYLINPIMPEYQPTILYGEKGAGKSRMALLFYICAILPWYDNHLGLQAPPRHMVPLILDYETDERTVKWRMKCLQLGLGLPPIPINYRRCFIPIADDIEAIQEAMAKVEAEWLIIDSLAAAVGGDLMDTGAGIRFFTALRQLKTTSLSIGQTQKDPEKKFKTVFGAGIYEYYGRSIWEVRKAQTQGENEMHVALHHRKSNEDMLHKPYSFHFSFNGEETKVTRERIQDIPEFFDDMSMDEKIIDVLKGGSLAMDEIAEATSVSMGYARTACSRLKRRNLIIRLPDKSYGLKANE